MSLLSRQGTMVRKNRNSIKRSIRRKQTSSKRERTGPPVVAQPTVIQKDHPQTSRILASTVVSFDDQRHLWNTSVDWRAGRGQEVDSMYDSVLLQLKEASHDSHNTCQFLSRSKNIICHTVLVTVLVGVSMTLPVAMIFIGVKYINDCPIKRSIPIYLLVGGCSGVLRILATMWRNIRYRRQLDSYNDSYIHEDLYVSQTYRLMDVTLSLFLIGWLIAGSHWVFSVWEPPFSQPLHEPSNWCDRTVYNFAVYQIAGSYAFLFFVLSVSCGLTIYHKACS
ncbi:transmembrane protein 272-like [Ostrea edulis]|uniref:transmembrane protein 272-like n=1 Tax=Ostrea edulis TaxID=37623 RepID=UPI0024AFA87F|nr:transmembrane protein 272-like [Ostrea edulis]